MSRFQSLSSTGFFLLLNHMDAWGSTLIIATLALLLHDNLNWDSVPLVAALTTGYWLAFALNDYFDAPYDAVDPRKARRNFFVHFSLSRRQLLLPAALLSAFPFLILATYGWFGLLMALLAFFVPWAYSAPPLRLKNRPGLDLLTHALFVETFPYITCLLLTQTQWMRLDIVMILILFLASLTAQLEQQLRDFQVDVSTGTTFATRFGHRSTAHLLKAATAVLALVAVIHVVDGTIPLFVAAFGLISLPALLHRFLRDRRQPRSEWLITLSAAAGLLYTGLVILRRVLRP